jgi:hypothetical protein
MAQILGPDQARLLMGHDIDSRTMERYYINWAPIVDVSAVTLNEPQRPGLLDRLNAPLATTALSRESLKILHGAALNAIVRQMIANDDSYPFGGS